jgi:hypothetical protein
MYGGSGGRSGNEESIKQNRNSRPPSSLPDQKGVYQVGVAARNQTGTATGPKGSRDNNNCSEKCYHLPANIP